MATRKEDTPETTRGPEEIRADIEETREQLGDTVEALAEKADVKHQAKLKVGETKDRFSRKADQAKAKVSSASPDQARSAASDAASAARRKPLPFAVAGAFAAGVVIGLLVARRR
jgi:ElaB/YqjD/DUF883 family membrane-anchored ribosome-binding protein